MKKFLSARFLISLTICIVSALVISGFVKTGLAGFTAGIMNDCFESINADFMQNKNVTARVLGDGSTVRVDAIFLDMKMDDGSTKMRFVEINSFNEIVLPLFIYLALFAAAFINDKKRYKSHITGLAVFLVYLYFKIFAIVFDNYNYPGMAVKELWSPLKQLVYGWNFFLNQTGSSSNLVIVLIIWLAFSLSRSDFENKA